MGGLRPPAALLVAFILTSLLLPACAPAPPDTAPSVRAPTFPDSAWTRATPAQVGLDPALLDSALAYLQRHCGRDGLRQTALVKDGYLVYAGSQVDSAHNIYSCAKGLTSTVAGILQSRGALSLDDRAAQYEPVLAKAYPDVTLRHFATMTSGYSAEGVSRWDEPSEDWGWTPYVPTTPYFAPGTAYAYWDEAQMMYGRVLTQALQGDLYDVLDSAVMVPIGVRDWAWGPEGQLSLKPVGDAGQREVPIRNGCTGIELDALEFARVGWLFANRGVWAGDTLVPPSFAREAMTAQVSASLPVGDTDRDDVKGPGVYGYGWWTASPDGGGAHALPDAPADAAYLSGFNHNVCYVSPTERLVLVRMGEDGNPAAGKYRVYNEVARRLSAAVYAE